MKKIISLLSVFAMVATMFTTVALADENNYFYFEKDDASTDTSLVVTLKLETEYEYMESLGLTIDLADAVAAGLDLSNDITLDSTAKRNLSISTSKNTMTYGKLQVETPSKLGKITINLSNVKKDFDFVGSCKVITEDDPNTELTDLFSFKTFSVKAPVTGPTLVENDYVFSFRADEETDVRITHSRNGDKTYDLPNFVDGAMEVWGLLKITEGADVKTGDTFKIETVKNRELIETIKTITVQAADLQ